MSIKDLTTAASLLAPGVRTPSNGTFTPPIEHHRNTLIIPDDTVLSHETFTLGEGTYKFRDEITLGVVPPHPSETTAANHNVLDTKPIPPSTGVALSIAVLAPRKPTPFRRRSPTGPNSKPPPSSGTTSSTLGSTTTPPPTGVRVSFHANDLSGQPRRLRFGENNTALYPPNVKEVKESTKRRKPKSSITKSSSSFVSRALPHELLTKRLNEHKDDGAYAIANVGRALLWLDLSSATKQEQLMKVFFTRAHALCHDFNEYSKTSSHLEFVLGFNTAEFIWYEVLSQKYSRINKNAVITKSPVSCVRWLPGSDNLFISAHFDGTLLVFDKEKDDAPFVPEDSDRGSVKVSRDGKRLPRLIVRKSVNSRNQKTNPIAVWKATNERINGMVFSPDGKYLALACEDGSLRLLDFLNEKLVDLHGSYYGGFTCVCWSPDSLYLLTGGQDDLVSIWSVEERTLLARCAGHKSWVSCVAFDPWRGDETTYRFGSVGDDGRLLLWDFNIGMLNQPIPQGASTPVRLRAQRNDSDATMRRLSSEPGPGEATIDGDQDTITYPVLPRAAVQMLPPVMSKEVDPHALTWLRFEDEGIIVACRDGHIRTWDRPPSQISTRHIQ